MFKYFALAIDYFLVVCYFVSSNSFDFTVVFVILTPIFHTLAFLVKPHCHQSHCKPIHPKAVLAINSQSNKNNDILSPMKMNSPLLEDSSPSPTPFTIHDDKRSSEQDQKPKKPKITKPKKNPPEQEYQQCQQCGLIKWIRMHHCYYCHVCVHKYDHHCVLLGICIGEANQKYYIPFLWAFFISSIMQTYGYYGMVGDYLWVDERGYEHVQWPYLGMSLVIIFFVFSTVIVGYLAVYHTYLGLMNDTTYQMRKRPDIYYFKGIISDHPFNKGVFNNLKMLMTASSSNPIEWQRPQRPIIQGLRDFNDNKNIFDHDDSPEYPKFPDTTNF